MHWEACEIVCFLVYGFVHAVDDEAAEGADRVFLVCTLQMCSLIPRPRNSQYANGKVSRCNILFLSESMLFSLSVEFHAEPK